MPNITSAKKRLRQNVKQKARNRWRKAQVSDAEKNLQTAIAGGKKDDIDKALCECYGKLDVAASKGTIHKNAAARKKSRLTARVNQLAEK